MLVACVLVACVLVACVLVACVLVACVLVACVVDEFLLKFPILSMPIARWSYSLRKALKASCPTLTAFSPTVLFASSWAFFPKPNKRNSELVAILVVVVISEPNVSIRLLLIPLLMLIPKSPTIPSITDVNKPLRKTLSSVGLCFDFCSEEA